MKEVKKTQIKGFADNTTSLFLVDQSALHAEHKR